MKELRRFIQEQLYVNKVAPTKNHIDCFNENDGMSPMIECSSDYFSNRFSNDILRRIYDEESFDPVLENLNTHDAKLLIKKLNQYFSKYIEHIEEYKSKESDTKYRIGIYYKDSLYKNEEFVHLVEFYGYKVSQVSSNWIGIIAVYAESAKEIVEKNHYRFYHFTSKKNVHHILKNGLQIRKGKYREFPERVHLYSEYRPISQIRNEIERFAKKVTNINDLKDIAILKIDLHEKYNRISFYKDDAMFNVKEAVYCYYNIIPKYIKEIQWN